MNTTHTTWKCRMQLIIYSLIAYKLYLGVKKIGWVITLQTKSLHFSVVRIFKCQRIQSCLPGFFWQSRLIHSYKILFGREWLHSKVIKGRVYGCILWILFPWNQYWQGVPIYTGRYFPNKTAGYDANYVYWLYGYRIEDFLEYHFWLHGPQYNDRLYLSVYNIIRIGFWLTLILVQSRTAAINILQWRQNGYDGVSNHQRRDCLLNRLFGHRSKKTSKLRITGLCARNSPVTGEFPAQMASNTENVSFWWRHHEIAFLR